MPVSSAQVSGLIGGQQVMFSNQAQMAQQIGGLYGIQQPQSVQMQNPYPSYGMSSWGGQDLGITQTMAPGGYGQHLMGAAGGAIPGTAAAISLAAGFASGPARYLDPVSGVASAFRAGTGAAAGSGAFGTLGHIGEQLAAGGIRGGAAAIGGGLMAAALPMAGYYAAGKAITYAGSLVAEKAQDFGYAGQALQQTAGPSFGSGASGGRVGGKFAFNQIKDVANIMQDLSSQDAVTTMESVRNLLQMSTRMGMLTGVVDAKTFGQKFSKIVEQVKGIAKVLGSSLEEAAPLFGAMNNMNMWKTSDIMGTALSAKMAGPQATPNLIGSMQQGAGQSWQMGGSLAAGARMGRGAFEQVQSAMRTGAMDEESLRNMTGGVGGLAGQQALAGQMTGMMSRFGQSSVGRSMMAALGEMKEGRFTGEIDKSKLKKFMSGSTSVGELMSQGMSRVQNNRTAAMSFENVDEELSQNMLAEGGIKSVFAAISGVAKHSGNTGKDAEQILMRQIMGVGKRESANFSKFKDKLEKMESDSAQRRIEAAQDSIRGTDERMNRSWEGLTGALGHKWEEHVSNPVGRSVFGAAAKISETFEGVSRAFTGRGKDFSISGAEMDKAIWGGALKKGGGGGFSLPTLQDDSKNAWFRPQTVTGSNPFNGKTNSMRIGLAPMMTDIFSPGGELGGGILENMISLVKTGRNKAQSLAARGITTMAQAQAEASFSQARVLPNPTLAGMGIEDSPETARLAERISVGLTKLQSNKDSMAHILTAGEKGGPEDRLYQIERELALVDPKAYEALQTQKSKGSGDRASRTASAVTSGATRLGKNGTFFTEHNIGLHAELPSTLGTSDIATRVEATSKLFMAQITGVGKLMVQSPAWKKVFAPGSMDLASDDVGFSSTEAKDMARKYGDEMQEALREGGDTGALFRIEGEDGKKVRAIFSRLAAMPKEARDSTMRSFLGMGKGALADAANKKFMDNMRAAGTADMSKVMALSEKEVGADVKAKAIEITRKMKDGASPEEVGKLTTQLSAMIKDDKVAQALASSGSTAGGTALSKRSVSQLIERVKGGKFKGDLAAALEGATGMSIPEDLRKSLSEAKSKEVKVERMKEIQQKLEARQNQPASAAAERAEESLNKFVTASDLFVTSVSSLANQVGVKPSAEKSAASPEG